MSFSQAAASHPDSWSQAERGLAEPLLSEDVKEGSSSDLRSRLRDVQLFARRLRTSKKTGGPTPDEWHEAEDMIADIDAALRSGASITRAEQREFRAALATIEAKQRGPAPSPPPPPHNRRPPPRDDEKVEGRDDDDDDDLSSRQGRSMELEQARERTQTEIALEQDADREIANLNERSFTVNQIFRDIASLVTDQQEDVDSIESQISTALTRTNKAQVQLMRANARKSAKMKCCFYFAIALTILGFLLVLAIIGFKNVAGAAA